MFTSSKSIVRISHSSLPFWDRNCMMCRPTHSSLSSLPALASRMVVPPSYRKGVSTCATKYAKPLMDKLVDLSITFEPIYRVILINSDWVNDKDVAKKIKTSVPPLTFADSLKIARQARVEGRAIVITAQKDDAIYYLSNLKNKGLIVMLDEA